MDHTKRLLGLEKTLSGLAGYEGWMIAKCRFRFDEKKRNHAGETVDFNQLEDRGYHHKIMLMDERSGELYSSKFIFHVIELKKLEETSEEEKKQELYRWARMIAARSWEEVCMEAKGNPYMEAAKDVMDKINQSETERYLYLRQEMAITDEKSS